MSRISQRSRWRSAAVTSALLAATGLAFVAAPVVSSAGAVGVPYTPPTGLTVSEANGTVTAAWAGAVQIPAARSMRLQAHTPYSYQLSYTCTLLNGYGVAMTFTQQTTATTCSFYGLDPRVEYGVQLTTVETYTEGNTVVTFTSTPETAFPVAFSAPTTTVPAKHVAPKKHVIVCVKGTVVRHYAAVHPTCPAGFTLRH